MHYLCKRAYLPHTPALFWNVFRKHLLTKKIAINLSLALKISHLNIVFSTSDSQKHLESLEQMKLL